MSPRGATAKGKWGHKGKMGNGNRGVFTEPRLPCLVSFTICAGQGPNTPLVHYTYDDSGNIETVTTRDDGSTRDTTYSYDGNNRVTLIDYPGDLGDEEFQYDEVGNLVGKMDGAGVVTAYEYDDLNRLIAVGNMGKIWENQPEGAELGAF